MVEMRESGGSVGHALKVPEGVATGSQAREGSRGEKVEAFGETSACDIYGWDRTGGDSLGDDSPPPEREGGLQGHWYSRGVVSGVLSFG